MTLDSNHMAVDMILEHDEILEAIIIDHLPKLYKHHVLDVKSTRDDVTLMRNIVVRLTITSGYILCERAARVQVPEYSVNYQAVYIIENVVKSIVRTVDATLDQYKGK